MLNQKKAMLVLADGLVLHGYSVGINGHAIGELVFHTSMTGYQEMLTDPSYAEQLIVLTTAHVGNTGCNSDDMESTRVWSAGLIVRNTEHQPSNYRSEMPLPDWLKKFGVVAISGVDTRFLTQYIRDHGAQTACIVADELSIEEALCLARAAPSLAGLDLAKTVTRQTIEHWYTGQGEWSTTSIPEKYPIVVYDFGVKHSILRILRDLGCLITIVPAQTSVKEVLELKPLGIVLSNGPGDPTACGYAIEATRFFLEKSIPLLGICLGFQLLALACGARVVKMKFGHHGSNHPVIDVLDPQQKVIISSQNHGFAVEESSLPADLQVTHRSLFDQSLQGIMHCDKPALGFQGHPEASPGPHDGLGVFDKFIHYLKEL